MKKEKKGLRSSPITNLTESGKNLNDSFDFITPALIALALMTSENRKFVVKIKKYYTDTREERIVKLIHDICVLDLCGYGVPSYQKIFLEKLLAYEIAKQNYDIQLKQNGNKKGVAGFVSSDELPEKMIANCTINELGNILGNFRSDSKNLDGDHVFTDQRVTISEWGSLMFCKHDGSAIKATSILNELGKGTEIVIKDKKPAIP